MARAKATKHAKKRSEGSFPPKSGIFGWHFTQRKWSEGSIGGLIPLSKSLAFFAGLARACFFFRNFLTGPR
jgi:hypothetical protein